MFILSPDSIRIDEESPSRVQFTTWSLPTKRSYCVSLDSLQAPADEVETLRLAKLLASAQDLLQALEDALIVADRGHILFKPTFNQVKDVIKKAKGL